MPDLGKYAFEVLAAYGVSLTLLVVIVATSLRSGRSARRTLDEVEQRTGEGS